MFRTMINDNFILTSLKANDSVTKLIDCDFIEIDNDTRLYYKKEDYNDFFEFGCVTITAGKLIGGGKPWERDDTEVIFLFKGTAMFDGIRHIYFGKNNDEECNGYLYYPNIELMIRALQQLKKLEIKYCPQL